MAEGTPPDRLADRQTDSPQRSLGFPPQVRSHRHQSAVNAPGTGQSTQDHRHSNSMQAMRLSARWPACRRQAAPCPAWAPNPTRSPLAPLSSPAWPPPGDIPRSQTAGLECGADPHARGRSLQRCYRLARCCTEQARGQRPEPSALHVARPQNPPSSTPKPAVAHDPRTRSFCSVTPTPTLTRELGSER